MAREYGRDELLQALERHGLRLIKQFFQPCPNLGDLIRRSVAGNTFRSFQGLSRQPSIVFREWAVERFSSDIEKIGSIATQAEYDRYLDNHAKHLTRYWLAEGKRPLKFGPGRKLLDLLFKGVARHADISTSDRARLIQFLHVPLDSFSLLAVRQCAASGDFGPPVSVPATATMGFVGSGDLYNQLQKVMRRIARAANVPPICIDLVAWDKAHGVSPRTSKNTSTLAMRPTGTASAILGTFNSSNARQASFVVTRRGAGMATNATRDGLNSNILLNSKGASGGKGLPPRTHAIHTILFRSTVPLPLEEIEQRLAEWGYDSETVAVTRNHLRSLCVGWGRDKVIAAFQDDRGQYSLTREGRGRLAAGPFSGDLP